MIAAILGFLFGLVIVPVGMLFLSVSLALVVADFASPGNKVGLVLLFPVGGVFLILGGARLMRGKFGSWTFIQLAAGAAIAAYMFFLYQPLFHKIWNYAAQTNKAATAKTVKKQAPGSRIVRTSD